MNHAMKQTPYPFKVGLFGIGLEVYWSQFAGLRERLERYLTEVDKKLTSFGAQVVNLGLIDTPEKGMSAGHTFRQADVDIIFLHVTTYALSSTVLPVVQCAKVPVVILNLSPAASIDYTTFNKLQDRTTMTGEWLAYCAACPVPEIANVFKRSDIPFYQVTGMLHGDAEAWTEIADWVAAARVVHTLAHNRLGLMGHYYSGMIDIYTDLTLQLATFGGHIELLEVDELSALRKTVLQQELDAKRKQFIERFHIEQDCEEAELNRAALTSVALDKLVAQHQLGSIAYYYKGSGNFENEETMSSVILGTSLLTGAHVPVAGEYEVKNVQAMKIMDAFGVGGSFTEYYAMDFKNDVVLMGHDGPGHIHIAEGKIKVKPLQVYHGKVGKGLSVEMAVKRGPVTLLSIIDSGKGGLELLVAEGESVSGPILEIGNTNSRYRFTIGARRFVNEWNSFGPAHHCAVGVGHLADRLDKLGKLLSLKVNRVC